MSDHLESKPKTLNGAEKSPKRKHREIMLASSFSIKSGDFFDDLFIKTGKSSSNREQHHSAYLGNGLHSPQGYGFAGENVGRGQTEQIQRGHPAP